MAKVTINPIVIILLLLSSVAFFYFGMKMKEQEKAIKSAAAGGLVEVGVEYIKGEADTTKKWWQSLTNQWSQIWK